MASVPLVLLPYLQAWRTTSTGSFLDIRLLVTPRGSGSPIDYLNGTTGPSFAEAAFKFDVHVVSGDALPTFDGSPPLLTLDSIAPPHALALFQELVKQLAAKPLSLSIDPNPPKAQRPVGSRVKKFLPASYQDAVNYSPGRAKDLVTTGSDYSCALKTDGIAKTAYVPLQAPNPMVAWGQVIAMLLRTPVLAEAAGLIRPFSVKIPNAEVLKSGGFMFLTLGAGSPATGDVKVYATRIPALVPEKPRTLYSPVFVPVFNVGDSPPDYSEVFAEIEDYDDGWAKAVHCTQPGRLNRVKQLGENDVRPVKEIGVQLGWDDEQVTIWTDRQVSDALPDLDVPPGTAGYRVDVRMNGTADTWHSLVTATGQFVVGNVDLGLGTVDEELGVPIHPVRPFAEPDRGIASGGTFWLPIYYTHWNGPSLVLDDDLAVQLAGGNPVPAGTLKAKDPGIALTYGQTYEFQVRLMDHTGGGPLTTDSHTTGGPSPIATQQFRRFILPLAPKIENTIPDRPTDGSPFVLTQVTVSRPLLHYPAVACTGKHINAQEKLKLDIAAAHAERREPGLPDPDVDRLVITVEAESFPHDPLATDGSFQTIYVTTRPFPSSPDYSLPIVLDFEWEDQADVASHRKDAESQTIGPLKLPTARTLRIRMAATCSFDSQYFGAEDVCTGPSIYLTARSESTSEKGLFAASTPSEQFSAYFFQPDKPSDQAAQVPLATKAIASFAPADIASRLASSLGLRVADLTMKAQPGERVVFGCAAGLRSTISPDGSTITFSTRADLALRWFTVLRLVVQRDWTWDGFKVQALSVERDGTSVGKIRFPRVVNQEAMVIAGDENSDPRSKTEIIFIDSINPLPAPGTFPQVLKPSYIITPLFQGNPTVDPPLTISIDLPVTTPPTQVPKLASAGLALSPYIRDQAPSYTFSQPRQKILWLEFTEPLSDPRDTYFARVLRNVPDPLILGSTAAAAATAAELQPLPDLAIDPEPVRHVFQGQPNDLAGLGAMTPLVPSSDEPNPTRFALPLPAAADSPALFGLWTYELRVGHDKTLWSTAQGRFGSPLLVNGVQHPPPPLPVLVRREDGTIVVSAPHAASLDAQGGTLLTRARPTTSIWFAMYVQAAQMDGADQRNVLLLPPVREAPRGGGKGRDPDGVGKSDAWATAAFDDAEAVKALLAFGFDGHAGLSVVAVEMCAVGNDSVAAPLMADLGRQRILRTSGLTPVPSRC